MNSPNIGYIVACWLGVRRNESLGVLNGNAYFNIELHAEALNNLEHSIKEAVFVFNGSDSLPCYKEEVAKAHKILSNVKSPTKVTVLYRDNTIGGYGAWQSGLDYFKEGKNTNRKIDYTVLVEDDYIPILDNFDSILASYVKDDDKIGYVCQVDSKSANKEGECAKHRHAAVSNGLVDNEIYNKVGFNIGPGTPFSTGQLVYLDYFFESGYEMVDITEDFKVTFCYDATRYTFFGNKDKPDIFFPTTRATADPEAPFEHRKVWEKIKSSND